MRDTAHRKTYDPRELLIALEVREDSTVALVGAQGETIDRLMTLLQRLSRRDSSAFTGSSLATDESKLSHAAVQVEIEEANG